MPVRIRRKRVLMERICAIAADLPPWCFQSTQVCYLGPCALSLSKQARLGQAPVIWIEMSLDFNTPIGANASRLLKKHLVLLVSGIDPVGIIHGTQFLPMNYGPIYTWIEWLPGNELSIGISGFNIPPHLPYLIFICWYLSTLPLWRMIN